MKLSAYHSPTKGSNFLILSIYASAWQFIAYSFVHINLQMKHSLQYVQETKSASPWAKQTQLIVLNPWIWLYQAVSFFARWNLHFASFRGVAFALTAYKQPTNLLFAGISTAANSRILFVFSALQLGFHQFAADTITHAIFVGDIWYFILSAAYTAA